MKVIGISEDFWNDNITSEMEVNDGDTRMRHFESGGELGIGNIQYPA